MGTVLILPVAAFGQVKISLSAQGHKVQEEIHAKVENTGSRPVTFSVELGQTSPKAGEIVSTPSPFWVHQNSHGNWDTLMIGRDVGSLRAAVVLEVGKSMDFPFRLNDSGKMRLRLNYWLGAIPKLDCHTRRSIQS
jgi:hypothetical protein